MLDNQNAITELTDILDRDIETIVAMRMRAERKVSRCTRDHRQCAADPGRRQESRRDWAGLLDR